MLADDLFLNKPSSKFIPGLSLVRVKDKKVGALVVVLGLVFSVINARTRAEE